MMRVIGGRLADEVDVDVTGGLAAGRRLPVKVGAKKLEARVLDVGHPENGLGYHAQGRRLIEPKKTAISSAAQRRRRIPAGGSIRRRGRTPRAWHYSDWSQRRGALGIAAVG